MVLEAIIPGFKSKAFLKVMLMTAGRFLIGTQFPRVSVGAGGSSQPLLSG